MPEINLKITEKPEFLNQKFSQISNLWDTKKPYELQIKSGAEQNPILWALSPKFRTILGETPLSIATEIHPIFLVFPIHLICKVYFKMN